MKELDVRGLSCPEPVLILQKALDEDSNEIYKVLASEAHVVKNITHFANSKGKKVSVKEVDDEYEIMVE
ncbi:hypothetical protein HMPREF3188_00008 [Tissierellia bacterium KA00581]|nr:hypothetical protein HMPREF3188_00008 [Tissierellia bacterium KA00581]